MSRVFRVKVMLILNDVVVDVLKGFDLVSEVKGAHLHAFKSVM
jgi:hypothetical protein